MVSGPGFLSKSISPFENWTFFLSNFEFPKKLSHKKSRHFTFYFQFAGPKYRAKKSAQIAAKLDDNGADFYKQLKFYILFKIDLLFHFYYTT